MQTIKNGDIMTPLLSKGNKFTPEMLNVISQAKKGQKFWFENIQAKAPEGTRKLPTIILTVR